MGCLLDHINGPEDLTRLSYAELAGLSEEIREKLIATVADNGGHLAPNLGVVELTVALLRVFNPPRDKIIWDVGHQSYVYKMLTGRNGAFGSLRKFGGLSGFSQPSESDYDAFVSGHAGNSISVATGFAVARDLRGGDEQVVAVIGDGAMGNGMAYEAVNNVQASCRRLIIILNDNKMSISRSVGALSHYLNRIITGRRYNRVKNLVKRGLGRLPRGTRVISAVQRLEGVAKNMLVPGIFFEEMGLRYIGPIDGHNLEELESTLTAVKDFNRPVLVHVVTSKGQGYDYAREHPEKYHSIARFDRDTGKTKGPKVVSFSAAFGRNLVKLAASCPEVVAITAAMCSGTGLEEFRRTYPDRFFDVGIAEGHALTFAGGLAAAGLHPVVAVYATFLQRALDSVFHDIILQKLPVTICVDRAGLVEDGPTHHGFFDLAFLQALPGLRIMMPCNGAELAEMLELAVHFRGPVVIRYPRGASHEDEPAGGPLEWGRSDVLAAGSDLAIWAVGRETAVALQARELLQKKYGLSARVVNARFLAPFDREALLQDCASLPVFTMENNVLGLGLSKIVDETLINAEHRGVFHHGWSNRELVPHGGENDVRSHCRMSAEALAEQIHEEMMQLQNREEC